MNIVAFDTCLGGLSVAVKCEDGRLAHRFEARARGHAEFLMPMIEATLGDAGAQLSEIDRIAVTIGPGTFTGTRIGVAAARALALANNAEVIGFSSLLPIGFATLDQQRLRGRAVAPVLVAMDARRDQLYVQSFDHAGGELSGPELVSAGDAADRAANDRALVVGTGVEQIRAAADKSTFDRLAFAVADDGYVAQPNALHLLGPARVASIPRFPPQPLYLREADAKPQSNNVLARAAP